MSTDEVLELSTCEDQFIRPIDNEAAEQSSEEKQNNVKGTMKKILTKIHFNM